MLYLNNMSMRMSTCNVIKRESDCGTYCDQAARSCVRIRSAVGWSSRGISKDSLTRSNYFHAISPCLRKGEPAKKMQEMFVCHSAVEP